MKEQNKDQQSIQTKYRKRIFKALKEHKENKDITTKQQINYSYVRIQQLELSFEFSKS